MNRTVRCSCGAIFQDRDQEGLYTLVRHHLQRPSRESHYPVTNLSEDRQPFVQSERKLERDHRDLFEVGLSGQPA